MGLGWQLAGLGWGLGVGVGCLLGGLGGLGSEGLGAGSKPEAEIGKEEMEKVLYRPKKLGFRMALISFLRL